MDSPVSLERIAEIIATAPGWTRVGITAPDARTRAEATQAFASYIADRLDGPSRPATDPRQARLPL